MGHRAGVVIVADGRAEVLLDRWGAVGLPRTLGVMEICQSESASKRSSNFWNR